MKALITAVILLLIPTIACADKGDCPKLAAFKQNQEQHLNLSRYGLGLVNAAGYAALNTKAEEKYKAALAACTKEGA